VVENSLIYRTGDGMECTRGTSYTTYRNNTLWVTANDVSPRSQGIECAGAGNHHISILNNSFMGFSDGLQLNQASDVLVQGNRITATTYAITSAGKNVVIKNNVISGNRMGIGPAATSSVTISNNQIFNNGQPILSLPTSAGGTTNASSPALLGIDLKVDGPTPNDLEDRCADHLPDCDGLQNYPVLSENSSWSSNGLTLVGSLASRPSATYTIEAFGNHQLNPAGFGEGELYLGTTSVTTDASGHASFTVSIPAGTQPADASQPLYFTVTATNPAGSTSEFSAPIRLSRQE
ncbi:MAG TPA: right-handed parallel beta-helix repeat-containing protein, partial [Chloroflexota bacterium]|jgi:parallel beta-helix repeat protein|nr:right-handed parallel beta-helix repeat-containing protein [Chloroflexota bacterium]